MTPEDRLGDDAVALISTRGWGLDWRSRGVYLLLEASEFVEATRGKGDPLHEAGDVLVTFTAMLRLNGLKWEDVVAEAGRILKEKTS